MAVTEVEKRKWGNRVLPTMTDRMRQDSNLIQTMIDVTDRYNGDIAITLPDVEGEPTLPVATPNIIAQAIENMGMRAASVHPVINVPALNPAHKTSRDRAQRHRKALYAHWHVDKLDEVQLPRSYRQLAAYGTCSWVVMPDWDNKRARTAMRNPLSSYPDARDPNNVDDPADCGFVHGMSARDLDRRYGHVDGVRSYLEKLSLDYDHILDIVEWVDAEHIMLGVIGPRYRNYYRHAVSPRQGGVLLNAWPNRVGKPTISVPRRATLDRVMGQVATITGLTDLMAKMQALEMAAAEKAIFPDTVMMGRDGRPPVLVGGEWHDGRTGLINEVQDGEVRQLTAPSNPFTQQTIDRAERAARTDSGANPMFGGEVPNQSLRTGRAIDSYTGFSVDPRIQELQKIQARSLADVNAHITDTEKVLWPKRKYEVFSGWASDGEVVKYEPDEDFESNHNVVHYSFPGADIQGVTVGVGQLTGAGLMSKRTARVRHPYIEDPESEDRNIVLERLEDAALVSILQRSQAGELSLVDHFRIMELFREGKSMEEAFAKAQEEARERQSTPSPEGSPEQQTGVEAGIEGLSGPAQPRTIPGRQPDQQAFQQLLGALRAGDR